MWNFALNLIQIIAKDLPEVISTMREMGEKVRNRFNNIVEKQELRACDSKYIQNTIRLYSCYYLNLLGFTVDLS